VHFGLGSNTQIDSMIVQWPSGIVDELLSLPGDMTYNLPEGGFPTSTNPVASQPLLLNVYPNPVTDEAVIRLDHFAGAGLGNLDVNVYDMNGKLVYSEAALQRSIIILGRDILTSGMYFVEVTKGENRLATKKMLVQ
jgi:hypothetical protein